MQKLFRIFQILLIFFWIRCHMPRNDIMLSKNRNLESLSKNATILLTFLPLHANFKIFEFEISNSLASALRFYRLFFFKVISNKYIRLVR